MALRDIELTALVAIPDPNTPPAGPGEVEPERELVHVRRTFFVPSGHFCEVSLVESVSASGGEWHYDSIPHPEEYGVQLTSHDLIAVERIPNMMTSAEVAVLS